MGIDYWQIALFPITENMKNKTSRADFKTVRPKNTALLKSVSSNGKGKYETVVTGGNFTPSLTAKDLEPGNAICGKIVAIEDWEHKKMKGTKMLLRNGETEFEFPLYGGIAHALATYQQAKELNRKKAVGLNVRLTYQGLGEHKGKEFQAFEVAVAQ